MSSDFSDSAADEYQKATNENSLIAEKILEFFVSKGFNSENDKVREKVKDIKKKEILEIINSVSEMKYSVLRAANGTASASDNSSSASAGTSAVSGEAIIKKCQHLKDGKGCKFSVSAKSKTGNYCTRHAKVYEEKGEEKSETSSTSSSSNAVPSSEGEKCGAILKNGERKDQACGKLVVGENLCKMHLNLAKKSEAKGK